MIISNISLEQRHYNVGTHSMKITFTAKAVVAGAGHYEIILNSGLTVNFLVNGSKMKILGPISKTFIAGKEDVVVHATLEVKPPSGTEMPFNVMVKATNVDGREGESLSDGLTHS